MNKVILIGASSTLLKDKLGETIDSFDIVCRINSGGRPECLTGEYKDIIGSKTNIWLCKDKKLLFEYCNKHPYNKMIGWEHEIFIPRIKDLKVKQIVTAGSYILDKCNKTLKKFNNFGVIPGKFKRKTPTAGILSIFHLLDIYKQYSKMDFPISEEISKTILSLPMHPYLNKNQQDKIINTILDFYND